MFLIAEPWLTIVAILATVIILGLIISLHEFGHLVMAKKAGVMCYDYSIGFGPVIWKKKKNDTQYSVRAIPVGGFVQMAGMMDFSSDVLKEETIGLNFNEEGKITELVLDPGMECQARGKATECDLKGDKGDDMYVTLEDESGNINRYIMSEDASYVFEKNQRIPIPPYEKTVDSKSKPWRFLVFFAGPAMNFILAMIIYFIVSFAYGVVNKDSNEIGEISSGLPAESVLVTEGNETLGISTNDVITLKAGDKITAVNGVTITSWTAFSDEMDKIYNNYQTSCHLTIERESQTFICYTETVTGFNSIGLSNISTSSHKVSSLTLSLVPGTAAYGLDLGQASPNYKNSEDESYEKNIAYGDYLVGISINGEYYDLTVENDGKIGWGYLSYLVDTKIGQGVPDVQFEYYHWSEGKDTEDTSDDKYELISHSDAKVVEPYTDEVLTSQDVEKIVHYIGVVATTHVSFFPCIGQAFELFWDDFTVIFKTLKLLIAPSDVRQVGVSNLSGVVGIFSTIKGYVNRGIIPLLAFMAMLSVNLGIVNLLPIPALDGGKILFVIIEAITRKKTPKKVETIINGVFMLLLLALMIFVTVNDIMRL